MACYFVPGLLSLRLFGSSEQGVHSLLCRFVWRQTGVCSLGFASAFLSLRLFGSSVGGVSIACLRLFGHRLMYIQSLSKYVFPFRREMP